MLINFFEYLFMKIIYSNTNYGWNLDFYVKKFIIFNKNLSKATHIFFQFNVTSIIYENIKYAV